MICRIPRIIWCNDGPCRCKLWCQSRQILCSFNLLRTIDVCSNTQLEPYLSTACWVNNGGIILLKASFQVVTLNCRCHVMLMLWESLPRDIGDSTLVSADYWHPKLVPFVDLCIFFWSSSTGSFNLRRPAGHRPGKVSLVTKQGFLWIHNITRHTFIDSRLYLSRSNT